MQRRLTCLATRMKGRSILALSVPLHGASLTICLCRNLRPECHRRTDPNSPTAQLTRAQRPSRPAPTPQHQSLHLPLSPQLGLKTPLPLPSGSAAYPPSRPTPSPLPSASPQLSFHCQPPLLGIPLSVARPLHDLPPPAGAP